MEAKSLAKPEVRAARVAMLHATHIQPLTQFVDESRRQRGCGHEIPYFDPADGGIEAECLFVLEAPGPKAVWSGFVSRDNPDESAKNWLLANAEAGIERSRTAIWNIVPWYVGSGVRIRPVGSSDIDQAWPHFNRLFDLLPNLRVVALVGRQSQKVSRRLSSAHPGLRIMSCPHPSPMFVNRSLENRQLVLTALQQVAAALA